MKQQEFGAGVPAGAADAHLDLLVFCRAVARRPHEIAPSPSPNTFSFSGMNGASDEGSSVMAFGIATPMGMQETLSANILEIGPTVEQHS